MAYSVTLTTATGFSDAQRRQRHRARSRRGDRALGRNALIAGAALTSLTLLAAGAAMLGPSLTFGSLPNYVSSHKAMTIAWVDPPQQAQMAPDAQVATAEPSPDARPLTVAGAGAALPLADALAHPAPVKPVRVPLPHARPSATIARLAMIPLPQTRPHDADAAAVADAAPATKAVPAASNTPAARMAAARDITGSLGQPGDALALATSPTPLGDKPDMNPPNTRLAYAAPDEPAMAPVLPPGKDVRDIPVSDTHARKPAASAKSERKSGTLRGRTRTADASDSGDEPKSIFSLFKHKSPAEKLWGGKVQLASLGPTDGIIDDGSGIPRAPFDRKTAVYVIEDAKVYMPDGSALEAHSGLGDKMDDPRYVSVRMRGATPPHVYDLTPRESLFHGVEAIRMTPVGGDSAIFGRDGILAHTYMLGPSGQSNGCVSFRDYDAFLDAFKAGRINRLAVIARLSDATH